MRRARHAVRAVACGLVALAAVVACTPDVVSVDAANAPDRAATSETRNCGDQQGNVEPGLMLTTHDVWPAADDAGKVASDMSLDNAACGEAVAAATAPEPVSCELGFPWYAPQALPVALARLGVTRVRESNLLRVRPDRSVSGQVSEYILSLRGPAAAGIEQAAVTCDGVQASNAQPPVYTIRDDIDGITVALRVGYRTAVGLTFTGDGLNDATKLALLGKATDLASRAAPNG